MLHWITAKSAVRAIKEGSEGLQVKTRDRVRIVSPELDIPPSFLVQAWTSPTFHPAVFLRYRLPGSQCIETVLAPPRAKVSLWSRQDEIQAGFTGSQSCSVREFAGIIPSLGRCHRSEKRRDCQCLSG